MDLEKNLRTTADTSVCDCVYVFLSFRDLYVDGAHCILRIYSIMKRFIQDFLYYYKRFGPKYIIYYWVSSKKNPTFITTSNPAKGESCYKKNKYCLWK